MQSAVCGRNNTFKKLAGHQVKHNIDKVSERSVSGKAFHDYREILFSEKFIGNIEISVNKIGNNIRTVEQRHHVDKLMYL